MYLSSMIIQDRLKEFSPVLKGSKSLKKRKYQYAQIPETDADILPDHVLIVTCDFIHHYPELKNQFFVCAGTPSQEALKNNLFLCVPETVALSEIFRKLQEMFCLLNIWERDLRDALKHGQSLEQICIKSIPVFRKPIFVHDQNNELLVSVNEHEKQFKWQYDKITGKYCLPYEILNDFKKSEEYHNTMKTTGAHMFSEEEFGYRILYINLRINLTYVARICICELGDEIRQSDYELLEYLADIILSALQQGNLLVSNPMPAMGTMFHEILQGELFSNEDISRTLNRYGWKVEDPFFCASIFFQTSDYSINTMSYLTNRLLNIFSSCCIFLEEKQIVLVVNLNRYPGDLSDFLVTLSFFIGDDLLYVGLSKTGHNLYDFKYYFLQTELACQLGRSLGDSSNVYLFEDYIYRYFLHTLTKQMQPEMMLDSHLESLMEYDRKHKTEFTQTLMIYLQNERNVKLTTLDLGVHRSTMNYRIERIQSLLGLNLDDPQIRLQLLISFAILETGGKL